MTIENIINTPISNDNNTPQGKKKRNNVVNNNDSGVRQNSTDSKSNRESNLGSDVKAERKKKNRISCSICRNGGNLLLCDNCPKSFHFECLKLKEKEISKDEDWFCPDCM